MSSADKELDELTTEYMENISKILELTKYLETTLADGRFNLSKARYCLGNQDSVSSIQYNLGELAEPAQIQVAAVKKSDCDVEEEEGEEKEHRSVKQPSWHHFSIVNKHDEKNDEEKSDNSDRKSAPRDALKWFGILVPQSLRQAQRDFKRSLPIICELAERKDRLVTLRRCIKERVTLSLTTEQLRALIVKD